ncbi:MAG: hypothetical protein HZB25_04100 [Candidatus Eisenbacteria bacterium]|nr:hypothetical protein [Candidatus Eisenbacteria bacterium]
MYYQYADNPCIAPDSTGTVWASFAGAGGVPRDAQQDYALFALRLDLSGVSTGGCRGDLESPGGPDGVAIRPHYFLPCNGRPDLGSVLALVDDDAAIDYIPFEQGYDNLTWCGSPCPDSGMGMPPLPAALTVSSVTPEEPTADTNTGFTVLGSGFQAPLQVVFSGPTGRVTAETATVLNPNTAYVELIVPRWLAGSVDVIVRTAQDSAVLRKAIHYTKFRGVPDSLIAILHAKAADAALSDFNTNALPKLRQQFPDRALIALSRADLGAPSHIERTPDGWNVSYGSPNSGPFITVHFDMQFAIRHVYSRWSNA